MKKLLLYIIPLLFSLAAVGQTKQDTLINQKVPAASTATVVNKTLNPVLHEILGNRVTAYGSKTLSDEIITFTGIKVKFGNSAEIGPLSGSDTLVAPDPDPLNFRIDLLVVNRDGTTEIVTGDPGEQGIDPSYDVANQIPIWRITVNDRGVGTVTPVTYATLTEVRAGILTNVALSPNTYMTVTQELIDEALAGIMVGGSGGHILKNNGSTLTQRGTLQVLSDATVMRDSSAAGSSLLDLRNYLPMRGSTRIWGGEYSIHTDDGLYLFADNNSSSQNADFLLRGQGISMHSFDPARRANFVLENGQLSFGGSDFPLTENIFFNTEPTRFVVSTTFLGGTASGIEYGPSINYSNLNPRSLITKEYADSVYASGGGGGSSGDADSLGGVPAGDYLIKDVNTVHNGFALQSPNVLAGSGNGTDINLQDSQLNLEGYVDGVSNSNLSLGTQLRFRHVVTSDASLPTHEMTFENAGIVVNGFYHPSGSDVVNPAFFGINYKYQYLPYSSASAVTTYDRYVPDVKFVKDAVAGGSLGYTPISNVLSSGNFIVGSAGNVATPATMSGFGTLSNTGVLSLVGGSITGTAGAGFIGLIPQSTAPATPASGVRLYSRSTGAFSWKGTNGFERSFVGTGITADRTYTLPDQDGTLALLTDIAAQTYGLSSSSVSGSVTIDLSTLASGTIKTVTGDITAFNCTNGVVGKTYYVYLVQDGTGSRVIAGFDSKFHFQGSTTPYLNAAASSRTLYQIIIYSSTVYDIIPIYDLG